MRFDQLRYFVLVCDCGSFQRASELAYISRQALSKSVAALEKELEADLFQRSVKGVQLSNIGQFVYQNARPIIQEMDRLEAMLKSKIRSSKGILRLNTFTSSMYLFPPSKLINFSDDYPDADIELKLYEYSTREEIEQVINGNLDAALVIGSLVNLNLDSIMIAECQRVAVIPKNHPLAAKESIIIDDFDNTKLALCMNLSDFNYFQELCSERNISPSIRYLSETNFMYELCDKHGYIGLSFDFIANQMIDGYHNLTLVPLDDPDFPLNLSLVYSKNTSDLSIIQNLARYIRSLLPSNSIS